MRLLIVLSMLLGLISTPVHAASQSSTPTVDDVMEGLDADWNGWATKYFVISGISFTDPVLFFFLGVDFDDQTEAKHGMEELPAALEGLFAASFEFDADDFVTVSAGRIGDQRSAASADLESDDFPGAIGYVLARSSNYVVFGMTIGGLISPVITVAPYVEDALERIDDEKPATWQALRQELPQLDDMPIGYIDGDSIEDDDTPTPIATSLPRPTPAPVATSSSSRGLSFTGTGNFLRSGLELSSGAYSAVFTCHARSGEARLRWDSPSGGITLKSPSSQADVVSFSLLEDTTGIALEIACSGEWMFYARPDD